MIKAKVFYRPVEGSSSLSIYWFDGAKGDAIEAKSGDGVGFFSPSQEMLDVIFDDVAINDEQELFFLSGAKVRAKVISGEVEIVELVAPKHRGLA